MFTATPYTLFVPAETIVNFKLVCASMHVAFCSLQNSKINVGTRQCDVTFDGTLQSSSMTNGSCDWYCYVATRHSSIREENFKDKTHVLVLRLGTRYSKENRQSRIPSDVSQTYLAVVGETKILHSLGSSTTTIHNKYPLIHIFLGFKYLHT